MAIKIVMFSSGKGETFGLISIVCKEAIFCSVHTPTVVVLQMVRQWLFNGAVSSLPEVRNLALQALQKLLLASGSLCGLLQLATSLVLNTRSTNVATFDRQTWDCFDQLSEDGSRSAQVFIIKLVTSIQRFVVKNRSDSVTLTNCLNDQEHVAINNGTSNTLMASSIEQQSFLKAIERRSHLGMIILHILSELSTWQMKRIQKAEEFKTEQELESLQLEEPYSMEICSDFFDISHRLIVSVLSRWLPRAGEKIQNNSRPEEGNKEGSNIVSSEIGSSQDVYDALASSFAQFRFNADMQGNLNGVDACIHQCNGDQSGKPMFLPEELCVAVLKIVTANLRRLVFSKIDPIEVGIAPARVQSEDDLLSAPPALAPTVCLLEQLISLGAMRNDSLFPVSLNAAVAMEVGTEAFYPSAYQRTKILTSRMGKGATLEVQMRWPVKERGQEDPRYERLLLMLQVECIKLRIRHAIRGSWYFFLHLMVEIPSSQETEEMLTRCFAPCIKSAGFLSWQVAAGAQELPINLQRHLYWNRKEKMSQDSGVGWIRVYPKSVAAYDDVLQDVEGFLAKHGNNDGSMLRP